MSRMSGNGHEDRMLLDELGHSMARGFMKEFGSSVDVGLQGKFDDEDATTRAVPIRAVMVMFHGDLEDVVIAVSSVHEETLVPAMQEGVAEMIRNLKAEAEVSEPEVHVYEDHETALEELEALYTEPTINIHTNKGDVLLVFGSDFIGEARRLTDPARRRRREAERQRQTQASTPTPVSQFEVTDPEVAALLGIEPVRANRSAPVAPAPPAPAPPASAPPASAPAVPAAASSAPSGSAQYSVTDPEVAALLGIETAGTVAASAAAAASTARSNAAAAGLSTNERWARLLGDVEVELSAELGSTRMRLGDATGLEDSSVLTLDQRVDDPVNVYVNGALFATARLVMVDDEYGIEILEVLDRTATVHPRIAA